MGEMALQLEAESELGSLELLDGSHSYVAAHTAQYKTKNKEDMARAETDAMCAFLNQLIPIDYNKLSEEGNKLESHEAKISWVVDKLAATGKFTDLTNVGEAVESFWCKLKMADSYSVGPRKLQIFSTRKSNHSLMDIADDFLI